MFSFCLCKQWGLGVLKIYFRNLQKRLGLRVKGYLPGGLEAQYNEFRNRHEADIFSQGTAATSVGTSCQLLWDDERTQSKLHTSLDYWGVAWAHWTDAWTTYWELSSDE